MKPITVIRLVIDLVFAVLLLYALMYHATGDAALEWIGVTVFAICIAHNTLNWKWYNNIFKDTYNLHRYLMTAINALLAFTMATLIINGLLHSRTILASLRLPGSMVIRQMHTAAAYWCFPLIGAHLGLNWGTILNSFRKMLKTNDENRIRKMELHILVLTVAVFGIWSSFDRDMFSKLFLGFSFDYWPEERSAILFFTLNLSIMSL
jgi:hypothetical protein